MLAMGHTGSRDETPSRHRVLSSAPEELTSQRLRRLGEGVGKVVYASEHWVVRRERSASEIIALIAIWKLLRKIAHILPGGGKLIEKPSRKIRFLRLLMQGIVLVIPRGVWYTTHIGEIWRLYSSRNESGENLARSLLSGTSLVPERVLFPPTRVRVGGWPGWLRVSDATQRVEATLHGRLQELAARQQFDDVEKWLERFVDFRQTGWQYGVFSVDAHLKNFGVCGDRIVLIDAGGLTNSWSEIDTRLNFEQCVAEPHVLLGLASILKSHPEIAARFNARWRAAVSHEGVLRHWPE
jgi:hypothetical protein